MSATDRATTIGRAVARIDLSAIEHNCRLLRSRLAGGAKLCAVVKANGYGHGDVRSARAAVEGGAEWLAVATAAEADELRRHHLTPRLLLMGALTHDEIATAISAGADVAARSTSFVDDLSRWAKRFDALVPVHVKLDSGMGRLGAPDAAAALEVAESVASSARPNLELAGIWTHFATADEVGDTYFEEQLARFSSLVNLVKKRYPRCLAHAANSAALLRDERSHFDMARCGIAVYGLDPFQRDAARHLLRPALSLHSYVARTFDVVAGQSVGYGRTWSAAEPTTIGVVPAGYGDGIRRGLSNCGFALVEGRRCPIVGTISMDNLTVDLGPGAGVDVGEPVTLIGRQDREQVTVEEMAHQLDTINYEVTTLLTQRVERTYSSPSTSDGEC